jgi:PAS domain S-box-containing protein
VERNPVDRPFLEQLLGLDSSKIGFYAEVKQKIQELESTNLDLWTKKNELQAVFNAIGDGVLIFDSDGIVQYRNDACPQIADGDTLLGKTCEDVFHPGHRLGRKSCPVEAALRGQSESISFTATVAGSTRHFEATATPILDPQGYPSRVLLLLRDVTEKRLQELQLLQAEKMSSIGVLAAGVAHEINNPLNSVSLYAEALLRRIGEEEGADAHPDIFKDYLAVIVREAHRCKGIIESLLSFSRRSDGSMGPVDLNPLVKEVLELVRHKARYEAVEMLEDLVNGLPFVCGDPAGLRQVILNLTMNALQAIEGRGQVVISTRSEEEGVTLCVRDSGCGIPQELLDQIWAPFFTTKPVGQGLGLGLSLTYNIVRKHGGEIVVDSEPGRGSVFTVRLPLAGAAP